MLIIEPKKKKNWLNRYSINKNSFSVFVKLLYKTQTYTLFRIRSTATATVKTGFALNLNLNFLFLNP